MTEPEEAPSAASWVRRLLLRGTLFGIGASLTVLLCAVRLPYARGDEAIFYVKASFVSAFFFQLASATEILGSRSSNRRVHASCAVAGWLLAAFMLMASFVELLYVSSLGWSGGDYGKTQGLAGKLLVQLFRGWDTDFYVSCAIVSLPIAPAIYSRLKKHSLSRQVEVTLAVSAIFATLVMPLTPALGSFQYTFAAVGGPWSIGYRWLQASFVSQVASGVVLLLVLAVCFPLLWRFADRIDGKISAILSRKEHA